VIHNLFQGLGELGNGPALAYLFVGALVGMFFGVIPGLGGVVILSIALAFIGHISLVGTLSLFLAVQAGSFFSASVTSILLNTPAHPEAFAVTFDGFPMAQRGEAGRALGISATATCIGGLIGCAALVGFIQIINVLPTLFHPPEYVGLVAIALILVGTLGADSPSKAVMSAGIGVMISSIGVSTVTGAFRFTFGSVGLDGGISLVALALGCFAVPQMVLIFGTATTVARQDMTGREVSSTAPVSLTRGFRRQVFQGMAEAMTHWVALLRSALVGVVTGIIPGVGAFAANFLSYGIAQQTSRRRTEFGTGIPEGIIAPEGSSLSKEAAGLVPLIALGIPGGVGGALFLAALSIKGIRTGYGFAQAYPVLPYEMVWVVALGGIIGTGAGIVAAPLLARITHVPGPLLLPFILSLTVIGSFVADVQFFSVGEVLVFGIVGLALRRMRYSLAAFAVGLVLGPTLETNIYLTHTVYPGLTFLSARPFADVLFALALGVLVLKAVQMRRDARKERLSALEAAIDSGKVLRDDPATATRFLQSRSPYPLLGLVTTLGIAAIAFFFVIYGQTHYKFATAIMPTVGGGAAALAALIRLPSDTIGAWHWFAGLRERRRVFAHGMGHEYNESAPGYLLASRELEHRVAASAQVVAAPAALHSRQSATELGPDMRHARDEAALDRFLAEEAIDDGSSANPDAGVVAATAAAHLSELPPIVERSWGRHGQYTREVAAFAWVSALVVGCYVLGFNIGIPAFCAAYGLFATRRVFASLLTRLIFAVLSAASMWAIAFWLISRMLHIVFSPVVSI